MDEFTFVNFDDSKPQVRVNCTRCQWHSMSYDRAWTRHAGIVHQTMLCEFRDVN